MGRTAANAGGDGRLLKAGGTAPVKRIPPPGRCAVGAGVDRNGQVLDPIALIGIPERGR